MMDFRTGMSVFCLVARIQDSSRRNWTCWPWTKDHGTLERSVIQGFIVIWKIFGNGKNAGLAIELDLVC